MRRLVIFPQLHPKQVEHTRQVDSFLEKLSDSLALKPEPDAKRHPNCAATPGSFECCNALSPMCDTCPWWLATIGVGDD